MCSSSSRSHNFSSCTVTSSSCLEATWTAWVRDLDFQFCRLDGWHRLHDRLYVCACSCIVQIWNKSSFDHCQGGMVVRFCQQGTLLFNKAHCKAYNIGSMCMLTDLILPCQAQVTLCAATNVYRKITMLTYTRRVSSTVRAAEHANSTSAE